MLNEMKSAWKEFSHAWKKMLIESIFKDQTENMEHHQVTKPHTAQKRKKNQYMFVKSKLK